MSVLERELLVAPPPAAPPRRTLLIAGRVLTLVGLLLALVLAAPFLIGGLQHARAQQLASDELVETVAGGPRPSLEPGVLAPAPARGSAVALLEAPSIGLEEVVLEGSGPDDLQDGPGHLRDSPLPGQVGNVVVLGRRTTFGAPFARLDRLREGDRITLTTAQGVFPYRVALLSQQSAGQADLTSATADARLTLVTSDPALRASRRLVVVAALDGSRVAQVQARERSIDASELGATADPSAPFAALVWLQVLLVAAGLTLLARRSWRPMATYLVCAPVLTVVALQLSDAVVRLLPGTL